MIWRYLHTSMSATAFRMVLLSVVITTSPSPCPEALVAAWRKSYYQVLPPAQKPYLCPKTTRKRTTNYYAHPGLARNEHTGLFLGFLPGRAGSKHYFSVIPQLRLIVWSCIGVEKYWSHCQWCDKQNCNFFSPKAKEISQLTLC